MERTVSYLPDTNDPKAKWKNLQENYERHLDKKVSSHVHRGDLSSTTRLLGYNDAMMATCATFLVVPIRHLKADEKKNSEQDKETLVYFLSTIQTEVLMFFVGFLLVATIWESTNIRSIAIKRLDDMLVLLSILQMLATSVLPYSVALQGYFPGNTSAVVMTTIILILVEVIQAIIVMYAFASPRLLHIEMKTWPKKDVLLIRNALLKKNLVNLVFIVVGGLCEFIDYRISWFFFSLLILNPIVREVYLHLKRRQKPPQTERLHFYWFLMKGNISKERVEAFTDATTAIIACVMILDIVIIQFKTMGHLTSQQLTAELKHLFSEFLTFVMIYIAISLLWYVNHTVIHLFHTINTVLLYLQKVFLCFLSLLPLCGNIIHDFLWKGINIKDSKLAMRYGAIVMFLASLCNVLMLGWAYYKREKVLHSWVLQGSKKHSHRQKLYTEMKVMNIPFWSIVAFIGSFGNIQTATIVSWVSFISLFVTFIVIKLIFVNHIGKAERTKELRLTMKYKVNNARNKINTKFPMGSIQEYEEDRATEIEGRAPSHSIVAAHGEDEISRDEMFLEKLMRVEYNGNEIFFDNVKDERKFDVTDSGTSFVIGVENSSQDEKGVTNDSCEEP